MWDALKLPFRPQRKDHQATRKLIDTYGLELVLAVAAWSTAPAVTAPGSKQDGFWRSVLRGSASLAKNWETIYLQMREDPKGAKQLKSTLTSEDNDSRLQCSTKSGKRYKIYRSGPITTGQAWDHLDGEILQDDCIACRVDHRNRPLHGVGARDVNEMSCAPNDAQKQTLEKKYHFNGHRTTNNIYATI